MKSGGKSTKGVEQISVYVCVCVLEGGICTQRRLKG